MPARLTEATQHPAHHFWPDAVSLLCPGLMAWSQLLTGRHITDAYLLALAVENRGTFVTLDPDIPLAALPGAKAAHLVVLEAPKPCRTVSDSRQSMPRSSSFLCCFPSVEW